MVGNVNEWMIASIVLMLALAAACVGLLLQRKRAKAEREQLRQEMEHLRADNIDFRREISALERDFEAEKQYS